jgi:hypothetical protein
MNYLDLVSPLVSLTVSAAITSSFSTNVEERLAWLKKVLDSIDIRHPDIRTLLLHLANKSARFAGSQLDWPPAKNSICSYERTKVWSMCKIHDNISMALADGAWLYNPAP